MRSREQGEHTLISAVSEASKMLLKTVFSSDHALERLVLASVVPVVASAVWYYSHTVIKVTDSEQALWIQMWLSQQSSALRRVRRLKLLPPAARRAGGEERSYRRQQQVEAQEDDKEDDGGRFAPPKLEFQPSSGILAWAWFGWWPVSVVNVEKSIGYTVTVWFSPTGTSIARDLLLQGRQLWLNKRSKMTEIWLPGPEHGGYKVVARPSRPLASVIVGGNIKETLRQDAMQFLNSERWYVGKGIPYRRGYLLYGPPGCGKTSLITALAGDLRMPIVVIPLNDRGMDDRRLMQLMGQAPKNSLVLIEDIDCALPPSAENQPHLMHRLGRLPVTLSGLLNAIDGVGAQEGRLLFLTTNHKDRLDEALIRPGRVDVQWRLAKASKKAAGELYDQFFASSAAVGDGFSSKAVQKGRFSFLEKVEDEVFSFAVLQGVLMAARDDPNKVAAGMDRLLASSSSAEDPTNRTVYDAFVAAEKANQKRLEEEQENEKSQREAGKPVVVRLSGNPASIVHNLQMQQIIFCGAFATMGVPDMLTTSGVIYYEIEVLKAHGTPQFGFATKDGLTLSQLSTGDGVGDNATSWAIDGLRGMKWHNGTDSPWKGSWKEGSVIGLAANVDVGKIAVSSDGVWDKKAGEAEFGLVFCNESIKKGVFPAFSASQYTVRYQFQGDELKYGPPPDQVWKSQDKAEAINGDKDAVHADGAAK